MGFITIENAIKVGIMIFIFLSIYYLINIGNRYISNDSKLNVTKSRIQRALLILFLLAIIYILWTNFPIIGKLMGIMIASIIFSYLIVPLVKFFEDKLEDKDISRGWAIAIVYLLIVAFFNILLGIVLPIIGKEFSKFISSLPSLLNGATEFINSFIDNLSRGQENGFLRVIQDELDTIAKTLVGGIQKSFFEFLSGMTDKIPGIVSKFVIIAIVPVVSFYLIYDREKLVNRIINWITKYRGQRFLDLTSDLNAAMSDFIRGRLIMAAFVGVGTTVVMFILGIEFALVIGIITAVADIIPYIGPFLGFIPAFILAWIESPIKGVIMAISFLLLQWLENNVLGPKILSDSVGLHPIIILFCILIGASVGGVLGMIFFLPIVLATKIIIEHLEPELKALWNKISNK